LNFINRNPFAPACSHNQVCIVDHKANQEHETCRCLNTAQTEYYIVGDWVNRGLVCLGAIWIIEVRVLISRQNNSTNDHRNASREITHQIQPSGRDLNLLVGHDFQVLHLLDKEWNLGAET
jgi:hypothetical protein